MAPPRSVALTGTRARTRTRQRAVHASVGVASWIAFAGLWAWQLNVFVPRNWYAGVALIVALGVGWRIATSAWIAWSRSIYRRRHRRTSAVKVEVDFSRDRLGRTTLAPPGLADTLGHVVVSVPEPTLKRYELVTGRRTGERDEERAPARAQDLREHAGAGAA